MKYSLFFEVFILCRYEVTFIRINLTESVSLSSVKVNSTVILFICYNSQIYYLNSVLQKRIQLVYILLMPVRAYIY